MHVPTLQDAFTAQDLAHMRAKIADFNDRADEHERCALLWRSEASKIAQTNTWRTKLLEIADGYLELARAYAQQAFRLAASADVVAAALLPEAAR